MTPGLRSVSSAVQYRLSPVRTRTGTKKIALGLPRQIHGPRKQPMRHQHPRTHRLPKKLSVRRRRRHAAPIHYHLAKANDDTLTVRITAFPSPDLPNLRTSPRSTERDQRIRAHGTGTAETYPCHSWHTTSRRPCAVSRWRRRPTGHAGFRTEVGRSSRRGTAGGKDKEGRLEGETRSERSERPDPEHRRGGGRRRTRPARQPYRCFRFRQSARSPFPLARTDLRRRDSALQQAQACRRSIKPAAAKEEIG